MRPASFAAAAAAILGALILLCISWEWRIAPLRPGGSWLILKVLPLLPALPGILRGKRYTYRWASLMIVFYFAEGAGRAFSDQGASRLAAGVEAGLALAFFACAIAYVRGTR
jgi:uncharacterized membrane protein